MSDQPPPLESESPAVARAFALFTASAVLRVVAARARVGAGLLDAAADRVDAARRSQ